MARVRIEDRYTCETEGCHEPVALIGYVKDKDGNNTGWADYRKVCIKCHNKKTAAKHGLKNIAEIVAKNRGISVKEYQRSILEKAAATKGMSVKEYQRSMLENSAKKAGMSVVDFLNSKHEYRKYRGDSCENTDGRLGFVCTTNVVWSGMLDVDHIDGNPKNNKKENLQTLCKCCHAFKTNKEKDYATPGRKTLKKVVAMVDN